MGIEVMETKKNKNRGYQKLRVWNDAINYYSYIYIVFHKFPFELKVWNTKKKAESGLTT